MRLRKTAAKMNGREKTPYHPSDGYIDDPDVIEMDPQPDPSAPHPSDGDIDEKYTPPQP
jgi:hypothetical protein